MIKRMEINKFRAFENKEIHLGTHITAIAGRNSTGKSTLLAMLGNSVELKSFRALNFREFRTEFSMIIKGSAKFDIRGSNLFKVEFCDADFGNVTDYRSARITWQNEKKKRKNPEDPDGPMLEYTEPRFRLIPERKDEHVNTSAKHTFPCLYLGLSRLYPVGETGSEDIKNLRNQLSAGEIADLHNLYSRIMSSNEQIADIQSYRISNSKKIGAGIDTSTYDYLTNSAGQDNLCQIIIALLSFQRLSQEMKDDYNGGLLLIDEIDATLHPSAQVNLLNVLKEFSHQYKLQIIFTTHSLSLLKEMCVRCASNDASINNYYELIYCTKENGALQVHRNPDYQYIENEMLILSHIQSNRRVTIFVEDDEAKWFAEHLLRDYASRIRVSALKLGCGDIIRLLNGNPSWAQNSLVVLDGDAFPQLNDIYNKNIYMFLPGLNELIRPETVFYNYLTGLPSDHPFWVAGMGYNLSHDYFRVRGPFSEEYTRYGKERDRFKHWFNEHVQCFDEIGLFEYWKIDNPNELDEFINQFKPKFNRIARNMHIPLER